MPMRVPSLPCCAPGPAGPPLRPRRPALPQSDPVLGAVEVWIWKRRPRLNLVPTANLDNACARRHRNPAGREEETAPRPNKETAQSVKKQLDRKSPIQGLPVIVDDDAGDIHQKAAALGADAIKGQQRRGGDMQPLRSAADPKAGFIHVFDRRRCDVVSHDIGEALEAPGTVLADPGDGRGHQLHAEEIGQQLDQTLLGQQLVVQEIEHESANPRAVLHGRIDAVWKRRPCFRAASGASAIVRTMFGDDERPRLGQIEHLPGAVADARIRIEARAAPRAYLSDGFW